jgi:hypothetical protein
MTDNESLRPRGTVEVHCSAPNCRWSFWIANDDIRIPNGPFFCDECSEHARYEFVCSHRETAEKFVSALELPGSLLRTTLDMLAGQRVRVTVEKILTGEN